MVVSSENQYVEKSGENLIDQD